MCESERVQPPNNLMGYLTPWTSLFSSIGKLEDFTHWDLRNDIFFPERINQDINPTYSIPWRGTEWLVAFHMRYSFPSMGIVL